MQLNFCKVDVLSWPFYNFLAWVVGASAAFKSGVLVYTLGFLVFGGRIIHCHFSKLASSLFSCAFCCWSWHFVAFSLFHQNFYWKNGLIVNGAGYWMLMLSISYPRLKVLWGIHSYPQTWFWRDKASCNF